jgi:hypothetical protein
MMRKQIRVIGIGISAVAAILAGSYLLLGQAQGTPESQLIDQVAAAMGGKQRVLGVRTLVLEGRGRQGDLMALMTPDSMMVGWEFRIKRTFDLANGRMRVWQSNRSLFPARFDEQPQGGARLVNALDGDIAFTLPADGSMMGAWADANPDGFTSIGSVWGIGTPERPPTMEARPVNYPAGPLPPRRVFGPVAVTRRFEFLQHPLTIVRAALKGARVGGLRTEGNHQIVDITTAKGDKLTLAVDQTTKLPVWVSRMDGNAYWGDVLVRTTFSAYEEVDGLKLPRRIGSTLDKYFQTDTEVSWYTVDADVGDLAAPASVVSAAPDNAPPELVAEEVPGAPGVWKITPKQGEIPPYLRPDDNSTCLMELSDHMVLFDIPGGDQYVQALIAKARELRPNKPVTQLILSHFDPGHTAGLRAGVAAGMELITYKANVAIFTSLVNKKHEINPDELAKHPRPLKITNVDDSYVIQDPMREIQLYHKIGDPESGTMVIAYLPRDRVLVNTDAWNVITQQTPNDSDSPSMYDTIVRRHLQVERHVPLHSIGMPTQAEFMKQLAYTRTMEYQFFRLAQRLRVDSQF